jgi:hypothetical protein
MNNDLEKEFVKGMKKVIKDLDRAYVNYPYYMHRDNKLPKTLRGIHAEIGRLHTIAVKLDSIHNGPEKTKEGVKNFSC